MCSGGGGGGGGGGNLRVILVRVGGPVFGNLPHSYTWSSKKDLFIYLIEQNVYIFMYCLLILYTLFAVCKQSLQIIITILVSELNI